MQMCKVSDWLPIMPLCSLWPKASVGNVIVNGEDLCKVTLCNMLNFIYFNMDLNLCSGQVNIQLCGFHCIPGYSISVSISNFIHFTCLHVVFRYFLKTRFTKYAQIWFISFISTCTTTVQYRMVFFSYFCVISVISITLDHLTQNWVYLIHFSPVEA